MNALFELLLTAAVPLLFLIALGYVAGRKFSVDTLTLANIAIFIIAPIVNFGAMARLQFNVSYLLLPVILYGFATALALVMYRLTKAKFTDGRANVVGLSAGTGNTGYFGIPIVLALFGPASLGVYLLMNLGVSLYEITVGYYIAARNQSTARESLAKVARLPHLYSIALGLMVNFSHVALPAIFYAYVDKFVGMWIIVGMMLMGATLSRIQTFSVNWPLLGLMLLSKFVLWPLGMAGLIYLDQHALNLFDRQVHEMLLIIALVPLAVNVVAFSIKLDLKAGDAAIAVLISTLLAVLYLPLVLVLSGLAG